MQRARLQQLEAAPRPSPIRSRPAPPASCSHLRSSRPSVTASPGVRHGSFTRSLRHQLRRGDAVVAGVAMALAAGLRRCAGSRSSTSTMRSGTTSPCAIAEPRPQVAEISIWPSAVSLRPPPERARRHQRLDQHPHRGVGRRQAVIVHVAARMRGPQRRPAGAHGGEEFGFVGEAEEALELAGEIGALAVLDQRRGAHRTGRAVSRALRAPGGEQRLEDLRRDRLFVERQPDLHRQPALRPAGRPRCRRAANRRCRDAAS